MIKRRIRRNIDLERRALEIEQKNVGLGYHEEIADVPVSKALSARMRVWWRSRWVCVL